MPVSRGQPPIEPVMQIVFTWKKRRGVHATTISIGGSGFGLALLLIKWPIAGVGKLLHAISAWLS